MLTIETFHRDGEILILGMIEAVSAFYTYTLLYIYALYAPYTHWGVSAFWQLPEVIWRVYFGLVPIPSGRRIHTMFRVSGVTIAYLNSSNSSHGQTSGAKMVWLGLGNVVHVSCMNWNRGSKMACLELKKSDRRPTFLGESTSPGVYWYSSYPCR